MSFLTFHNHFLLISIKISCKVVAAKVYFCEIFKIWSNPKVCVLKIYEYWSSAEVIVLEMQKLRGETECFCQRKFLP